MQSLETLKDSLEFDTWANGLILDSFKKTNPTVEAIKKLGHILLAEKFWLQRILGQAPVTQISYFWSIETAAECEELFGDTRKSYGDFFAGLTEEKLETTVTYTNSAGDTFTNTLSEIFTHVFFHSVHHRGQIIEAIRKNGDEPPYVDFIGFLRR